MPRRKKLVHRGVGYYTRSFIRDKTGRRERIFAAQWIKENIPRQHFAYGVACSKLEALMMENDRLVPVSQETATAVATIVQWLGSPIGFSFLQATLEKAGYRIVPVRECSK